MTDDERTHLHAVPNYTPPRPTADISHWLKAIRQAIAEAKERKGRQRR